MAEEGGNYDLKFLGDLGKLFEEKTPDPLELRVEQELPENTTCLMDCEAAVILKGIQEKMVILSDYPAVKLPVGLAYAQRNKLYDNPQAVKQILKPLKQHGVSDGETKQIELRVPLENVLAELAKHRRET